MDRADKLHFPPFSNVTSFRKFSPISLSRCIHECKARSRCDAINYSKSWKLCDLIGGPLESAGGSRKGFVGGRKADWNMVIIFDMFYGWFHGRIQSGILDPPSLKNHKSIGFLSNPGPDYFKHHKATKSAFNVGPASARQQNAI